MFGYKVKGVMELKNGNKFEGLIEYTNFQGDGRFTWKSGATVTGYFYDLFCIGTFQFKDQEIKGVIYLNKQRT